MIATTFTLSNSTIVRFSSATLGLLRAYFSVTSRVLPGIARLQAERLFTTPPRYRGRLTLPVPARRETVSVGRHHLAVWQAGPPSAPAAVLVHGWGGRGVQLGAFVERLIAQGFRVVWFDLPGHGESGHGQVGLPEMSASLHALAQTHGPFEVAIGHSLGAAAIGLALRQGLATQRAVFVSPPASMSEHTRNFARSLGISARVREAMRLRLERRYGLPFAEIDRIEELAHVRIPTLFVHDHQDRHIPLEHSKRLSARMPAARVLHTHGLGHHRILRDAGVVLHVAAFARDPDVELPSELPRLPVPAPLY